MNEKKSTVGWGSAVFAAITTLAPSFAALLKKKTINKIFKNSFFRLYSFYLIAIAKPIPLEPPVMNKVFPFKLLEVITLFVCLFYLFWKEFFMRSRDSSKKKKIQKKKNASHRSSYFTFIT